MAKNKETVLKKKNSFEKKSNLKKKTIPIEKKKPFGKTNIIQKILLKMEKTVEKT